MFNLQDLPKTFKEKLRFLDCHAAELASGSFSAETLDAIFAALNQQGATLDKIGDELFRCEGGCLRVSRSAPIIAPASAKYWTRYNVPAKGKRSKSGKLKSSKPLGSQINLFMIPLDQAPSDRVAYPLATWRDALREPPISIDPKTGKPRKFEGSNRVVYNYPASRRGVRKRDARAMVCFWAEIDRVFDPSKGVFSQQWEAIYFASNFLGAPSLIVYSGSKSLHVFWFLREPYLIESEEDIERFEFIEKLLAEGLGGDPQVCDISHEMRTPAYIGEDREGRIRIQPTLLFDPINTRVDFWDFEEGVRNLYRAKKGEEAPTFEGRGQGRGARPGSSPAAPATLDPYLATPGFLESLDRSISDREKAAIERAVERFASARRGDTPSRHDQLNTAIACAARIYKSERIELAEPPIEIEEEILRAAELCEYIPDHLPSRDALRERLRVSWQNEQAKTAFSPLRASEFKKWIAHPNSEKSELRTKAKRQRSILESVEGIEIREFRGRKTNVGAGWVVSPDQDLATFNLFTAQCGEGKSEACKAIIEERRAKNPDLRSVWIVARKALGEITSKDRGAAYYLKKDRATGRYTNETRRDWTRSNSKDVVISINSLYRLAEMPAPDILIIDEFSAIFAAILMNGERSKVYESFRLLREWFETAEKAGRLIIACDAIAEKPTIENLRDLCRGEPLRAFVEPREVQALKGKTVSIVQEADLPSLIFWEYVRGHHLATYEGTKAMIKNICDFARGVGEIIRPGFKAEVFTADHRFEGEVGNDSAGDLRELHFWGYNGTIADGLSYKGSHFETAIVLIGKMGFQDSKKDRETAKTGFRASIQAALRARGVQKIYFVEPEKDFEGILEAREIDQIEADIRAIQDRHRERLEKIGDARFLLGDQDFFSRFEARERLSILIGKCRPSFELIKYCEEEGATIEEEKIERLPIFDGIKLRSQREQETTLARWFAQNNTREALRDAFEKAIGKKTEDLNLEEATKWTKRGYITPPETKSPSALALLSALFLGFEEDAKRFDYEALTKEGIIDPTKKRSPLEYAYYLRALLALLDPDFASKVAPLIGSGLTGLWRTGEEAPELRALEGPSIDPRELNQIRKAADLDPINARFALRETLIPLREIFGDAITSKQAKVRGVKMTVVSIDYSRAAELMIQVSPDFRRVMGARVDPLPIESFEPREASEKAVISFERRREQVASKADDLKALFETITAPASTPPAPSIEPPSPAREVAMKKTGSKTGSKTVSKTASKTASNQIAALKRELAFIDSSRRNAPREKIPSSAALKKEIELIDTERTIIARSSELRAEGREVFNLADAWIKIREKFPQLEGEKLKRA